jgi:transcriptional regulator with XRE-family HTH domain
MSRTLDEVIASLPSDERAKIEARATELIADETSLRDLRKAIGKTQVAVAKSMNVGQEAVSKVEMRKDMRISTLRELVGALGGELDLIVRVPDRPAVRLAGIGIVEPRRRRGRTAYAGARATHAA